MTLRFILLCYVSALIAATLLLLEALAGEGQETPPARGIAVVLGKGDGLVPASPYYDFLDQRVQASGQPVSGQQSLDQFPSTTPPPLQNAVQTGLSFPVITEKMSPGLFNRRPHAEDLGPIPGIRRPICLVGADPFSLDWIQRHRSSLFELGAVCLIVQAKNLQEARKVKSALGDIPSYPASADDIAGIHGLDRYPLLISSQGIEQ